MKYITIEKLNNYYDQDIEIQGFVDRIRDLQYVQFLIIKDSTGKVQITIEKNDDNKNLNEIVSSLTPDSTLLIKGIVKENSKVKLNGMEIIPSSITITSKSSEELPLNYNNPESANLDTRLDYRFLDLRNEKNILLFKVQSYFVKAMREFLYNHDFTEIHTPKLIAAASESGSEVFEVKYFKDKAYLAQSPQFYKQMAICSGFDRVFEVAPAFRAENSNSYRHATEFTSFDLEFAYIKSYEDVMKLEEEMITYALSKVKEKYNDKIKELFNTEVVVPTLPFPRIKLNDLVKELEIRYNYVTPKEDIGDMNNEMEKLTTKYAHEVYNHEFIFVTDYSAAKRPFYHMRKDNIPQGFDLIWRGCEITSGSQREHRYEVLKDQAEEKGLTNDVKFYLEFFKYGCPPHGGLALGIDRMTMLLLNLPSVKETMFLFRGPNRITP